MCNDGIIRDGGNSEADGKAKITFIGTVYNVIFDANGGTVDVANKDILPSDNKMGSMPTPTNGNLKFWGWYTDTTYKTLVTPSTVVSYNMRVYARWGGNEITFDYIGSTTGVLVPITGTYKLEVWGCQGENSGGKGGYSQGNITLHENDILTINVGVNSNNGAAASSSWNRNDAGGNNHVGSGYVGAGGAGTSILRNDTTLIVAGGGGGSSYIGGVTDGETIAGNAEMPTHDGTSTMIGNAGNGYAKITLITEN